MEGTRSRARSRTQASLSKRELILEVWNRLGLTAIGEAELREIQESVRSQFGPGTDESPAAIARVLADEGAELRHPEVIELDARWRGAKIESDKAQFNGIEDLLAGKPLRLKKAEGLIKRLEKVRRHSESSSDQIAAKRLHDLAVSGRQAAELLANDRKLNQLQRAEQAEIAEWLKLWIQTPSLFADWLELRRRSPDFQKKFTAKKVAP